MPIDYTPDPVVYDGTNPDPVEFVNDTVIPTLGDAGSRLDALEAIGPGVTGSVFFEGTTVSPEAINGGDFHTYIINNVVTNLGGGSFNTSTFIYTVPETGLYDCRATVRISDNSPYRSFGLGIGVTNSDAPHFLWGGMGGMVRDAKQYDRLTRFTVGDQVRLYIYSDGYNFFPSAGYLAIMKVAN